MRTATALAPTSPASRTPEREALARAIDRLAAATQRVEGVRAAQARNRDELSAARRRAERAAEGLVEATDGAAQRYVAVALGRAPPAGGVLTVEDATKEATAADTAVKAAESVRDALAAELTAAEGALPMARHYRDQALSDVLCAEPCVRAVFGAHVEAQRRVAELAGVIGVISRKNGVLAGERFWRHARDFPDAVAATAVAPWAEALVALEVDADALLPNVGATGAI